MRLVIREHQVETIHLACMRIEGTRSNVELAESHEAYRQLLLGARGRGQRHVGILDLSASGPLNAQQRSLQADWNRAIEPLLREVCLGFAFVTTSMLIRGMMTAVFWIREMPTPHVVFATVEEASDWALDTCEQNGVRVSASERAACRQKFGTMNVAA